jgi:hypothetical protein
MLAVAVVCVTLAAAQSQAPSGKPGLPPSVMETTRRQIQDYLGKSNVKGVPLLDAAIDWDVQTNWPEQFSFHGRIFQLDVRDLGGGGFRRLKSRQEAKPTMTVSYWYLLTPAGTDPGVTNFISPRATWTPGGRVADKQLMWGGWNEVGDSARDIFQYTFYPDGVLYKFHWQRRATAAGHWEVFDRNGKLAGMFNATSCVWNGVKVDRFKFWSSTAALNPSSDK